MALGTSRDNGKYEMLIPCSSQNQRRGAHDSHDMNVADAWSAGFTGKGVVVTVVDDGIQTNHPDLISNYVSLSPRSSLSLTEDDAGRESQLRPQ